MKVPNESEIVGANKLNLRPPQSNIFEMLTWRGLDRKRLILCVSARFGLYASEAYIH